MYQEKSCNYELSLRYRLARQVAELNYPSLLQKNGSKSLLKKKC